MKALEDLSTQYDLTVRNSVGVMIQVIYVKYFFTGIIHATSFLSSVTAMMVWIQLGWRGKANPWL